MNVAKQEIVATSVPQTRTESLRESLGGNYVGAGSAQDVLKVLSTGFLEPFTLVNVIRGEIVHADSESLSCDLSGRMELLAEVARRGAPEIVEDVAPLSMLAIPLHPMGLSQKLIAVGVFIQEPVTSEHQIAAAARAFGVDAGRALRWSHGREYWPPRLLLRMAESIVENLVQHKQITHLRHEINEAVAHARDTYVELGLLHRLTSRLNFSGDVTELWQSALAWLADSVPAQSVALVINQSLEDEKPRFLSDDHEHVLIHGECPAEKSAVRELVKKLGPASHKQSIVLNRAETSLPTWYCPTLRELVCVPINGGDQPLGWLLALNHKGSTNIEFEQFGSVEIRLLASVGTILGIHSRNLELYQKQSELFASLVRALTSAIDAKDRYTSGHSERVATVSVALARQLGLDKKAQDTIYLGGLLHDVGKIGIDDLVLNKPDRLSEEEFEHIKLHPQFGYDILRGVRQLDKILPIVLHHHEAWNGKGYPHGLVGSENPLLARIVAVADAFDAMSSDRPYRKGMPDEKLDAILRDGAGSQWDAKVIDAFFEIRDEIRALSAAEPAGYSFEGALG